MTDAPDAPAALPAPDAPAAPGPVDVPDPRWVRPALVALLVATGALYLWSLSANGWANEFYAAAVQAGSRSWKAFLFGSSDAANSITVDKPPASLWLPALSVRVFGLSSWSLLVPQALMGVATVGVVYSAVRRWFGAAAGILAGAVLALTPVAALMFRFNNPDALLVLLLTIAAYAALRAIEDDRLRWYLLTGVAVGLGFLTKQLQAFLVVPGFALALVLAGQGSIWRRLRGLLIAGVAVVVSAGWWVALVELWPESSRPYIGGTEHNSFLELTFGYNGLGRITGNEGGIGGGGAGPTGGPLGGAGMGGGSPFSGNTGIGRMFAGVVGTQIAWLVPLAALALVAGLVVTLRRSRRDPERAALVVWGLWLVVTAAVFSFMGGIFHEYYTVALAPAVAALVGIGGSLWWQRRTHWAAAATAAFGVALSAWWAATLLGRAPEWNPWLVPVVAVLGGLATTGLVVVAVLDARQVVVPGRVHGTVAGLAVATLLVGPAAFTLQTVSVGHSGSIVTAGPAVSDGGRGPGGFPGGGFPGGGFAGGDLPGGGVPSGGVPGGGGGGGVPGGGFPGGGAGATPSEEVIDLLLRDADQFDWVAAIAGATAAAPYQLATERPVMPIGGFSSSDPSPTLEQFQRYVEDGRIHWFIEGGMGGGPAGMQLPAGMELPSGAELPDDMDLPEGMELPDDMELPGGTQLPGGAQGGRDGQGPAGGSQSEISAWVTENFTSTTVDGVTLYDLTSPVED